MGQVGGIVRGDGRQGPILRLRVRGDKRLVEEGPFEQFGGYIVIEVPNLDAALEWAALAGAFLAALDAAIRAPLMLQVLLGLAARQIGEDFVVLPETMGQRLVRANAKIRDWGLRFAVAVPEVPSGWVTPEFQRPVDLFAIDGAIAHWRYRLGWR
jgi:YCII-related domain